MWIELGKLEATLEAYLKLLHGRCNIKNKDMQNYGFEKQIKLILFGMKQAVDEFDEKICDELMKEWHHLQSNRHRNSRCRREGGLNGRG